MPMPTTMEMNITEKRVRCPTVRVTTPMDQASVTASTPSMSTGLPTRMKARVMTSSVRAKASTSEMLLSWKAAVISSLDSAGAPVTPACTFGKAGRSLATASRIVSMAAWSPMKLPFSLGGVSTRMKSRLLSSERK